MLRPCHFRTTHEAVLAGLQWDMCLVYMDNIIVVGKSFNDMLENLGKIFKRLRHAGLQLKAKKYNIFEKKVSYLGYIISRDGVAIDPKKVKAVADWSIPSNVSEFRSYLGLCSYYRRFI